ncbi:MAG: hypothetical protein IJB73_01385 [Firmicutes bacterium]|nr:hypothetical protein [Bacillota bacterium]
MKNRDEFIQSVWEKSEKALAEERAQKARRRSIYKLGAAAAACFMLLAGAAGLGGPQAVYDSIFGVGSDSAAAGSAVMEGESADGSVYDIEVQDMENTAADGSDDMFHGADVYDGATSMPSMALDGALNLGGLNDKELYGELQRQTEEASKSRDDSCKDLMAYVFLPTGIEIECYGDPDGVAMYTADEDEIMKYMQWFGSLPENQVLTTEEFNNLKEIPTGYYKFTMDCSVDAETEGSDRVFWLIGEISLP